MHDHSERCPECETRARSLVKSKSVPGSEVWYRDRPMRELHKRVHRAYVWMYRRMTSEIARLFEGRLSKAEKKQHGPLTPTQIEALRQIVTSHHDAFVATVIGSGALSPAAVQQLIDQGVLVNSTTFAPGGFGPTPTPVAMMNDAFKYGVALGIADRKKDVESLTYAEWKQKPVPPPSEAEERAMEYARQSAAVRIKGLGNRVADDFTTQAIEADKTLRRQLETTVREELDENIAARETWRKLGSELSHASDDWSRDWSRIAATEKMDAMIDGQARAIVHRSGRDPEDVRVAKQPNPDACKDCVRLYTEMGRPKIFLLSVLTANGTNVGKKRDQWLPTLGPIHPWCACELIEVPDGWGFDDEGNLEPLLRRADFEWNLIKSLKQRRRVMTYGDAVGDHGVTVRVADPAVRAAVEEVLSRTPQQIFTRATGVTLVTTDHGRPQNPLEDQDYGYWAGNEIRLQQTIDPKKVRRVLEHEIGHALNSWLFTQLESVEAVREWHEKLWNVSKEEGHVSEYSKKEPIENAAEVSRLYLFHKTTLRRYPRQFAMCHRAYGAMFKQQKAA